MVDSLSVGAGPNTDLNVALQLFASSLYAAIILKLFSMLSCTHNAEGQLVVAQAGAGVGLQLV